MQFRNFSISKKAIVLPFFPVLAIIEQKEIVYMKILVTAFLPFGGLDANSSYEVVRRLPKNPHIYILYLPVNLHTAFQMVKHFIEAHQPDVIICTGQAAGRDKISIEIKAKNEIISPFQTDDEVTDEQDFVLIKDGEKVLFSSFPSVETLSYLLTHHIPVELSNDAGTYISNALFYQIQYYFPKIDCTFIHFPLYQTSKKDQPSLDLNLMVQGLQGIIDSLQ